MTQRPHSDTELRAYWKQYERAGFSIAELARTDKNKQSRATWDSRLATARDRLKLATPMDVARKRKVRTDTVSDAELKRCWEVYADAGYNAYEASRRAEMSPRGFTVRLDNARAKLGLKEPPLDTRERLRLEDKVKHADAARKSAERALNEAEDLRKSLFGLTSQDLAPPQFKAGIARKSEAVPSIPFVLVSDEQAGEVIKAGEIESINEYNSAIYRERHRQVFRTTIDISRQHMRVVEPGIVVGWLGDAISGSIHAELRETNDIKDCPAVKMVVEERRDAILTLLEHYKSVFVVIIPGNHGRLTQKPQYKHYVDTNLEAVIGWWLQSLFENNKRVKIVVPPSGDYFMPLWGWNTFFTHGDRLGTGGGQGFIGTGAPIIRGSKKVYEQQAKIGRNLHYIDFGHWHTRMETPYGFANGCLCGFGEFSYGLRFIPAPAEQWLYYLHPERGVTARWPIYLTDQPKGHSAEDAIEFFKGAKAA